METAIFRAINNLANHYRILDWLGIFLAKYLAYFAVIALLYFWYREKNVVVRFKSIALTALSLILSRGIITEVIRFFDGRPRPPVALPDVKVLIGYDPSASFPSGHAAFFFALALAVYYFDRRWGKIYFLIALLIGLARIFAGVHWPLDILAGAIVGLGSAFFMKFLLDKYWKSA